MYWPAGGFFAAPSSLGGPSPLRQRVFSSVGNASDSGSGDEEEYDSSALKRPAAAPRTSTLGNSAQSNGLTPDQVQRHKEEKSAQLEEELKLRVQRLGSLHRQQLDELHASINRQKREFDIRKDEEVKSLEMQFSQEYNHQLMQLQQAAQIQRAQLEQQAMAIELEWHKQQTRQAHDHENVNLQSRYSKAQKEIASELEKVVGRSQSPSMRPQVGGQTFAYALPAALVPRPARIVTIPSFGSGGVLERPLLPSASMLVSGTYSAPLMAASSASQQVAAMQQAAAAATAASTAPPAAAAPRLVYVPPRTSSFHSNSGSYVPPPAFVSAPGSLPGSYVPSVVQGPVVSRRPSRALSPGLMVSIRGGGSVSLPNSFKFPPGE